MLIILGGLLLIGLIADLIGQHTPLPRVTVLLVAGVLVGSEGFDVVPREFVDAWFTPLTQFALAMVGFLLGQQLTLEKLRERGTTVTVLAAGKVIGAAVTVAVVLVVAGVELPLALILAGIAAATAPAATFDVVAESGVDNEFSRLVLSIVALDDALGLVVFSLLLAAAGTIAGMDDNGAVLASLAEVGGSLVFGAVIGVPMAYLTGRIGDGSPTQAEAFGFVLICAGGAVLLDLSPILAAMMMGAVVGSLAAHHQRPFHVIEQIEWPFMTLFFVLAGASLEVDAGIAFAGVIALYILARGVGSSAGLYGAGAMIGVDAETRIWLGPALLPQAGVAIGMALIAAQRFEAYSEIVLGVVLASTVLLEIASPVVTRAVLRKMS